MKALTIIILVLSRFPLYKCQPPGALNLGSKKNPEPKFQTTSQDSLEEESAINISEEESQSALNVYHYKYQNTDFHYQNHQDLSLSITPVPEGLDFKNTCLRQYFKCLISQSAPEPVCAYNHPYEDSNNRFVGFISVNSSCDVFMENCRRGYRVWRTLDTGVCEFIGREKEKDSISKDIGYKPQYPTNSVIQG